MYRCNTYAVLQLINFTDNATNRIFAKELLCFLGSCLIILSGVKIAVPLELAVRKTNIYMSTSLH